MYRTEHYLFAQRNAQDRKVNFNLVTDRHTDGQSDICTSRAASLQLKNQD